MATPTFNLATDPWLGVISPDGATTVSLIDAFARADTLTLAAGSPLADQAVHRLLTAIAYTATGAPTSDAYPRPLDQRAVAAWVREHADLFSLTDPDRPFMQDPALATDTTVKGDPIAAAKSTVTLDLAFGGAARPRVTDHRLLDVQETLTPAAAATALVTFHTYSVGGLVFAKTREGRNASAKAAPTATAVHYRPLGTIAAVLAWSVTPTDQPGTLNTTYTPRPEGSARGQADALTWLPRRMLLDTDADGQVVGVRTAPGWVPPTPADPDAPADTCYGQDECACSRTTPGSLQGTGLDGLTHIGYNASTGDPVALSAAFADASPASLAGRIRAAAAAGHQPPAILATGLERSKSKTNGVFTCLIDPTANPERAQAVIEARRAPGARTIPSLPAKKDTHPFTPPTGMGLLHADGDPVFPRMTARDEPDPDWPRSVTTIWAPTTPETAPDEAPAADLDDLGDLGDLMAALASDISAAVAAEPGADRPAQAWRALNRDREAAATLAAATTTHTPTPADVAGLGLDGAGAGERLWAGLAATWLTMEGRSGRADSDHPLPLVWRWAARSTQAARLSDVTGTADPTAARVDLLEALRIVAAAGMAPSWRSLHADLTGWTPQVRRAWRDCYVTAQAGAPREHLEAPAAA